jgi:hypothetical protein
MNLSTASRFVLFSLCVLLLTATVGGQAAGEPGLLFFLSGSRGLTADCAAGGNPQPNFAADVTVIHDGAIGDALQCGHMQVLSYGAPGNIYSERGTLSFFWRSREPVGPTEFPIFRVGYADHSSWDMVWLRIDYNGRGFDAFVTDASLSRIRVSTTIPAFPAPAEWTHLAFSWDETKGIRFYVNGKLAAQKNATAILYAALDQFGPHSRTISPMQVQSAYNFVRGGDIDEIRIYDRMLSDDNVASLSHNEVPKSIPELKRDVSAGDARQEWWYRYGWNRPGEFPPPLEAQAVSIRKIEIHDAYDLKRWWWKGTDGIRETTWPGVYNRSRLPGRNDYFPLPDWDCYSLSGKSVTFYLPDEPWNQIEISGAAWGNVTLADQARGEAPKSEKPLFERPKGQERTIHRLPQSLSGGAVRFTNVEQEEPIGEFEALHVTAGKEPEGIAKLTYRLTAAAEPDQPTVKPLVEYIRGRYQEDERATMVALPAGAPRTPRPGSTSQSLPIVHVLVPADFRDLAGGPARAFSYTWMNMQGGLDGIAVDLPALKVKPTHGDYFPMNIQVKDPIWPLRNMIDVSFSVKPGEPHTLWLDTRDRILPNGKALHITIAGAGPDFGPEALEGAELRLIFKPLKDAKAEHVLDRLTQVRDNYAQIVEEHANSRRLSLYDRFETDLTDLLRVDPENKLGREYWYDMNKEQPKPPVKLGTVPKGVPAWAFRQIEAFRYLKSFVNWYIDRRQIDNGELGGGLSDDGDLTNWWPGTALMGANPEKIERSLSREMGAFYENGMFTNGLPTIQADELHSYEEGISALGQSLTLDYGSPKQLERAMETANGVEKITGINAAGHRHFRSAYFSGTKIAEDGVWGWTKPSSYLVLHPALMLVEFNGSPHVCKWILELADGILAHRKADADGRYSLHTSIEFKTDRDLDASLTGGGSERVWPVLWAAYRWTGDHKYLQPLIEIGPRILNILGNDVLRMTGIDKEWGTQISKALQAVNPITRPTELRHFGFQLTGDAGLLEKLYTAQAEASALREYINTEGSLWIDRVSVDTAELQRARLGGVAIVRNSLYPGHVVSWKFAEPDGDEKVAIAVQEGTPEHVKLIAYNLDSKPVKAQMTGWDVLPGTWKINQGTRATSAEGPLSNVETRSVPFERTESVEITFAPRTVTVLELSLLTKSISYWSRPDLGIGREDVQVSGRTMDVTVHSLGAVDAPASRLVLRDTEGRTLATAAVPPLKAPLDVRPKTFHATLLLPNENEWKGGTLTVEPGGELPEITRRNNVVKF